MRELKVAWPVDAGPVGPGPKNSRTRWVHNMTPGIPSAGKPCRGVRYYRVPGATGFCAERIYGASQVPTLVAVYAHTGRTFPGFGAAGTLDLNANIIHVNQHQSHLLRRPLLP
ncbi:MAG: hypothetical protein V4595_12290 [Pseudomonadota bacterium]